MTISVLYYVSFGWLGTVVGIVGLILAVVGIVLTLRSRAVARLVYQTRDLVLVGQPDAIPYGEVKILFNDNVVPRVMVSHLAVWNAGNTTIRSNDVVESDPMKVAFDEGAKILGARRLAVTRDVNKFRVVVNRDCLSEAYFQFDYLDGGDGVIFEIMHTGLKGRPRITGSLRGIPKGAENWGTLWNWEKGKSPLDELRRSLTVLGAIVTVGGMAIFLVNYLRKAHPNAMSILDLAFNVAMSAIIGGVFLVFIILLWVGQVRRSPKSLRLSGEK